MRHSIKPKFFVFVWWFYHETLKNSAYLIKTRKSVISFYLRLWSEHSVLHAQSQIFLADDWKELRSCFFWLKCSGVRWSGKSVFWETETCMKFVCLNRIFSFSANVRTVVLKKPKKLGQIFSTLTRLFRKLNVLVSKWLSKATQHLINYVLSFSI